MEGARARSVNIPVRIDVLSFVNFLRAVKLGRRTYSMSVMVLIFEQLASLTLNVLGVQVARGVADRVELARVGLDLIFLVVDG